MLPTSTISSLDEWWEQHRVHQRTHGSERLRHPLVGDLTVDDGTRALPGDPDTTLYACTTEIDPPSRRAIDIPASRTATEAVTFATFTGPRSGQRSDPATER
jgi:hypothetical protein